MVGARNPAPPLAGYAAPYAAETSRYVPPLYTYPTKFMHNLCHIVMWGVDLLRQIAYT